MIPNILHIIWSGGGKIELINYICIKSAILNNNFDRILIHTDNEEEPNLQKLCNQFKNIEFVHTIPPNEIYGNPIKYIQHKSDILRLQKLYEYGGVYVDTDCLCVKSFADLLDNKIVLGKENTKRIGQAVIMVEKESPFIKEWLENYHDFDGWKYCGHELYKKIKDKAQKTQQNKFWVGHSMHKMMELVPKYNCTILNNDAFYKPNLFFIEFGKFLNTYDNDFSKSYCHHLCLSTKLELKKLTEEKIYKKQGYFYLQCKKVLQYENSNSNAWTSR